jgi:hypothetical protein
MSEPGGRMSISIPRELRAAIQSYRLRQDPIPTTSEAIRQLLTRGLEAQAQADVPHTVNVSSKRRKKSS